MTSERLTRCLEVLLARAGYVVAPGSSPFDLEARSGGETLLIQVEGEQPDERSLWSTFVGAIARLSLLVEDPPDPRATLCLAFSDEYESHVRTHLGSLDPRLEVFLLHGSGRIERIRQPWPGLLPGPRRTDAIATADTVVAKRPEPPSRPSEGEHPDGTFAIAQIEYEVREGRLVRVEQGAPRSTLLSSRTCAAGSACPPK